MKWTKMEAKKKIYKKMIADGCGVWYYKNRYEGH